MLRLIFTIEIELGVFTDLLSLLLLLLLPDNSLFFCSLKIVITETCSRASILARLTSKMA